MLFWREKKKILEKDIQNQQLVESIFVLQLFINTNDKEKKQRFVYRLSQ